MSTRFSKWGHLLEGAQVSHVCPIFKSNFDDEGYYAVLAE